MGSLVKVSTKIMIISFIIGVMLILRNYIVGHYRAKSRYWLWFIMAICLLIIFVVPQDTTVVVIENFLPYEIRTVIQENLKLSTRDLEVISTEETLEVIVDDTKQLFSGRLRSMDFHLRQILFTIWIVRASAFLFSYLFSYAYFLTKVRKYAEQISDNEHMKKIWYEICDEYEINKDIKLYRCNFAYSPMLIGFFNPKVLLPSYPLETNYISYILKHEAYHWKRRDIWYKFLFIVVNAIHWYNPLVWHLRHMAYEDVELACDEDVIQGENLSFRREYGWAIYSILERSRTKQMQVSTFFVDSSKKTIRRFEELLMKRRKRKGAILLSLVLIAIIIPVFLVSCENNLSSKFEDSNHGESAMPSSEPLTGLEPFIHRTQDPLENAVYNAIQTYYKDSLQSEHGILITAPIILKEIDQADEVKVIIYVKMTEYKIFSDRIEPEFSMSLPSAIIFKKVGENKYELKEYITPEDGDNYPLTVRAFCQPDGELADQILARKAISNIELNELLENNLREYIETNKLDIQ